MYLAGILELWMLLAVSLCPRGSSALALVSLNAPRQEAPGSSSQSPPAQDKNQPAAQEAPKSDSPSASAPGQSQNTQSPKQSQPGEHQPGQTTPSKTEKSTSKTQPKQKKPAPNSKDASKESSGNKEENGKKTVVHHGSTSDPIVQLTPGITQEQAEKQRQRIQQALATTDANLQKLSGIQLTSDKQEIVTQIRKFVEQSRDATETGDLQRAENLALKAQLLSSDLVKQ